MAEFDYTEKGWKKIQPMTLKKTGLTAALKTYESAVAALRKATFFDQIMKAHGAASEALEAVETARLEAIRLSTKSHKDCAEALEAAKPAAQTKLIDDIALTALNKQVIYAVGQLKKYDVPGLLNRAKLAQAALGRIQKVRDLKDDDLWSLRGEKLDKILDEMKTKYGDEGDNKGKSLVADMGSSFPLMFVKKSLLAGRFPTVLADVTKLENEAARFKDAETEYNMAIRQIFTVIQAIKEKYLRIKAEKEKNTAN